MVHSIKVKEMDRAIDLIDTSSRKPKLEFKQQMTKEFWRKKQEEIDAIEDFNKHAIPMRRLKKVVCAKKAKIMMRFDTPSFLTKACVTTPLQLPTIADPNILNTCCIGTIASTSSYCVGYDNPSSASSQDGGAEIHYPHIPTSLQFPPASPVVNNSVSTSISIIELNHIQSEVAHIGNAVHLHSDANAAYAIDPEATINASDDQHQHGNLVAEVIPTINVSGDNKNIHWDEVDMADDSLLINFWENVMMNEDPATLLTTASTVDLVVFPHDMLKHKGFHHEVLDDIDSTAAHAI
ncbi:hypothetical protein HU200_059509 [Digitaria exilis]|uniref:Uncharacterized protein n=1 Tax=Digitaria exilis TaxID=1010633 RepID=A0A835AHZ6_9POAL|nr:hypothetical protein HU200_059509 [Digitaria exilis]